MGVAHKSSILIFPDKPSSYWGTTICGNPHLRKLLFTFLSFFGGVESTGQVVQPACQRFKACWKLRVIQGSTLM